MDEPDLGELMVGNASCQKIVWKEGKCKSERIFDPSAVAIEFTGYRLF